MNVLPNRDKCYQLMEQQGLKGIILEHSEVVNLIAVFLGRKLVEKQELIDLQLLDRASLLHDIAKLNSEDHATEGAKILKDYPKVAMCVEHHRLSQIKKGFEGWEDLLVYYSDKRVKHNKIVSVDERMDDLIIRYPRSKEKIEEIRPMLKKLENQIFEHLDFSPEDLNEKIF